MIVGNVATQLTNRKIVKLYLSSKDKTIINSFLLKVIIFVISLFPITTLFQGYFSFLNILLVIFLITPLLLFFIKFGFKRNEFLIDFFSIILSIISLCFTDLPLYNMNLVFYFPIFVIISCFFCERQKTILISLIKNKKILEISIYVWSFLIVISMLFPSSYTREWGDLNFSSFAGGAFRLAPTAILEMAFLIFLTSFSSKKRYLFISIIPLFCFFFGGSRTYFVLGVLSEIVLIYFFINNTKKFFALFIILLLFSIPIFLSSSIYQKFIYALQDGYYDFWGTFTSGRSIFWAYDIEQFFKLPFLNLLFGKGYNFVYDVNLTYFNAQIWAHNDFIQILTTHGFLGLCLYVYIIYMCFFKNHSKKGIEIYCLPLIIFFAIRFFNAFVNMFYTYFCSMLCLPFYLFACKNFYFRKLISRKQV